MNDSYKNILNGTAARKFEKTHKRKTFIVYTIGIMVNVFAITPCILYWMNHIAFQYHLPYWKYVYISIIFGFTSSSFGAPFIKTIFSYLILITLIIQMLSWINLCKLPIFN